nr:microtubule-associated protein 70-2 [Quercus suber]
MVVVYGSVMVVYSLDSPAEATVQLTPSQSAEKSPQFDLRETRESSHSSIIYRERDVESIPKTNENFYLLCDTKGRFRLHSIRDEEAKFKLCKVCSVQFGQKGTEDELETSRTGRSISGLLRLSILRMPRGMNSQLVWAMCSLLARGQNHGYPFPKEENKILDKMHWQKVAEVEKLTQTVRELEEAVLAGGAAANAVCDYQRKVQEMNEERKTLEREVARVKFTANRVATVVANEWKDANDKVMPVKQWLEERKFFQREMQQLCDKLAVAERTTKAEAQLKEKYQMRFKVLEERLNTSNGNSRIASEGRTISNGSSRRQSLGGAENFSKSSSNGYLSKRTSNSHYGLLRSNSASTLLKHNNISTRSFDGGSRSLDRDKLIPDASGKDNVPTNTCDQNLISETNGTHMESANGGYMFLLGVSLVDLV